jgi:hypothetical protein
MHCAVKVQRTIDLLSFSSKFNRTESRNGKFLGNADAVWIELASLQLLRLEVHKRHSGWGSMGEFRSFVAYSVVIRRA